MTKSFFSTNSALRQALATLLSLATLLAFGLLGSSVNAAISTNTATSQVSNFSPTVKAASNPTAVLGLNVVQSASETLNSVRVTVSGSTGFTTADLNTLGTATTSGLSLFIDNGSTEGSFDSTDANVALSAAPTLVQVARISKLAPSGTSTSTDAALSITAGDIVFAKTTANPTATDYNWHIVTTGATGVWTAGLRLDDAGGQPIFASSTQFSKFTPAATVATYASSTPKAAFNLAAGDLVFGKVTANSDSANLYAWHIVTTAENVASDTLPSALRLDSATGGAPGLQASSQFSKLAPAGTATDNGATGGGTLTVAAGDVVFVKIGSTYGFHIVTTAGDLSSDATENTAFLDGESADPVIVANSQIAKLSTSGGTFQITTAATSDTALAITAGDVLFGQITQNPAASAVGFKVATTGGTGVSAAALRLNNATAAPNFGWVATLTPAAAQTVPANDTTASAGADFYVAVATASGATNGRGFAVGINPGDAGFSANTPATTPIAATTPTITIDTVAPTINTSMTGPANGSTNVPISAFIHVGFSENLDQSTLNSTNITFTANATTVPAGIRPFPNGFDIVVSSPPTYASGSRFAKAANTQSAFYNMSGSNAIAPQGAYISPTAGDIIITQREVFPPEVGLITNATLTSGTFAVNNFPAFGGQQITKFGTVATTSAVSAATAFNKGDIVVVNTTANPTDMRYNWHIVTSADTVAVNDANFRLDSSGSAPTFMSGSSISAIAPSSTVSTYSSSSLMSGLNFTAGALVFAKITAGGDNLNSYAWHMVTTGETIASGSLPSLLRLDDAAAAPTFATSSQISILASAASAIATDTTTSLAFGDIVMAKTTANASNNNAYAFHMVSAGATGAAASGLRFDNAQSNLTASTNYVTTIGTGVKDTGGNALASQQTVSFTTGSTGGTNTTPPYVQSSQPMGGSQNHPTAAPVRLTFSVDMSVAGAGSATSTSNIVLSTDNFGAPGTPVTSALAYDSTARTVTLTPSAALAASTNYVARVATTTTSTTGANMMAPYFLFFKTSSGTDAVAPTVLGVSPAPTSTGVSLSAVVTAGFSEDMDPSTITTSTITLKKTSNSAAVTGNVSYNPSSRSASFAPSVALEANTGYTFTVVSGGSGAKDLSGNALAANYNSTFTTTATADTAAPYISFSNADNFSVAVTFNETMKTGGGPNAADNIANYTLESPTGSTIGLGGKTVTYDAGTKTARITGLSLTNGNSYKITVASVAQDLASNVIDTTGTPARNTAFGTVQNSSSTGGQIGPGSGTIDAGMQGMNPTRVFPMVKSAGLTSQYHVEFLASTAIPATGQIVLTFPSGFDVTNASAVTAGSTGSFCNSDLNGPMSGTVTIGSISNDNSAGTVTIATAGATTGSNAFLCMDLNNIINSSVPSTAGYTVTIQTKDTAANNRASLQTLTASPFFLGQAGSLTLTVNVFNDNGAGGGTAGDNLKTGSEPAIAGVRVFLFSPAAGGNSTTTNASGVATFGSLASGDYMLGIDPSTLSVGGFSANSAPQPINIAANTTKNYGLAASAYTISGTVYGPAATAIDIFASSPTGFAKMATTTNSTAVTYQGTDYGGSITYTLPASASTTYNVGVGPQMPETAFVPGAPPPAPPTFTFMPPANQQITISGANATGKNFTLATAGKTITGTVKDSSASGVSNAGVFCRPVDTSTMGTTAQGFGTGGMTQTDGSFSINVTAGVYLCGVFKPGMPPVADRQITVPASGSNTPASLNFVLDASTSLTITGTVKDDSGNAIAYSGVGGRKVNSTSDTTPVGGDSSNFVGGPTDANGAYTLYVTSGTWVIEAFAPGFGRLGTKTVTVTSSSLSGQDFSAQNLSLGTITGSTTQASVLTQGVMVRAEGSAGANMSVSDAGGSYSLKVPAGSYTVTCYFPGVGEVLVTGSVTVTADNTTTGKDCSAGTLVTITVNLTDGVSPLTNAYVDVRDSNGRGNGTSVSAASSTNATLAVYSISVPPGTYTVRAGHPAFGQVGTTASVNSTRSITYTASAGALQTVSGSVTGDGSALSGAWVSLSGQPSGQTNFINMGTQSGSDGTYSLTVPAGSYSVRADKPGYKSPAATSVTVTSTTTVSAIAMTTAARTISGTITVSGSGVSGAFVDATDGSGGFAVGQTNASGAYSLAVDNGTWTVRAHSLGYEGGITVTVLGNNPTDQNIGLTAISGFTIKQERQETVTPSSGGFITNTDIGSGFKMNIPANALGTGSNAGTVKTQINTALPTPPTGSILKKNAVTISAVDSSGQPIKSLNGNVTVVVPYDEANLPSGASEANLVVGVWNDSTQGYDTLSTVVDTTNNTLTVTVDHFSDFAPMISNNTSSVSSSSSSSSSSSGGGGSGGGGGSSVSDGSYVRGVSITLNSGATVTKTAQVTVRLSAIGANEMMLSNTSDFSGAVWEKFTESKNWTLTAGKGSKTVYVKLRGDAKVDSLAYSYSILLDPDASAAALAPASGMSLAGAHKNGTLVLDGKTVYLIKNGRRFGFRNPAEYQSHGYNFAQVVKANAQDLSLPLESAGVVKALEGTLVLDASDSRTVYMIGVGGSKRGFASSAVFKALGYSFANLPKINLADYPAGPVITAESEAHPEGALVLEGKTVWWIREGKRQGFESMAVFNTYGFSPKVLVKANAADLALEKAVLVKFRDGTLVKDGNDYYTISEGKKLKFKNTTVLNTLGYKVSNAIKAALSAYEAGETVE